MSESDGRIRVEKFPNTEIAASTSFTWEIRDWTHLDERQVSDPIECDGYLFQVLLFPQGNPASPRKGHLALYLNSLGPTAQQPTPNDVKKLKIEAVSEDEQAAKTKASKPWHVCAAFALTMYNPESPKTLVTQSSHHRFTPKVTDWGYSEFTNLRSAFVPSPEGNAPLIAPLKPQRRLGVNIRVDIDILADPTGILWHDFQEYDSREVTGYTGLVNQGATCYLNSLLQSLYFTSAFRNAVYSIPDSSGVTGGLQRLFYKLATSHPPVDTTDLTKAFGWDSADAFTQHDVQELARVLMDRLETKMKNTQVDGFLTKLFVGQMKSYIKCTNVPFESSRTEDFWDIQLNVKNMKNVYASFQDYCASETLEGDNQYAAGDHGLQDAIKGVTFQSLPPVLHLQLKRYDYDWMREVEVKINDRFEFPLELDLSEFVEPHDGDANAHADTADTAVTPDAAPGATSDATRSWKYHLHGVLVHSGELNAGHYYALIKPEVDGDWFRFDDDRVTKAALHEVLDENFGGNGGSAVQRVTSAYMLVYILSDSLDFVLPKGQKHPPTELCKKIEQELQAEELRQKAVAEQQQFMTLRILSESTFKHHTGLGILPWSSSDNEFEEPTTMKVRLETPLKSLCQQLQAGTLWLGPPNPTAPNARARSRKLQQVPLDPDYCAQNLASWVDHPSPLVFIGPEPIASSSNSRMVFLKRFANGGLRGIGVKCIDMDAPSVGTALDLKPDERLYVEVTTPSHRSSDEPLLQLDPNRSGGEQGIESSDILIVADITEDVEHYFDTLVNRMTLHLIPIYDEEENDDIDDTDKNLEDSEVSSGNSCESLSSAAKPVLQDSDSDVISKANGDAQKKGVGSGLAPGEYTVDICLRDSYETIVQQIGEAIGFDPDRLQLRSTSTRWKRSCVISSSKHNISDLWSHCQSDIAQVLYRKLPVKLTEFETMVEVPVNWLSNGYMEEECEKVLLYPPEVPALEIFAKQCNKPIEEIAMWVGQFSRKAREISPGISLGELNNYQIQAFDIYAARLPIAEVSARKVEGHRLLGCYHFHKDINRSHSVPFQIALVPDEPFAETKQRIFELLRSKGKEKDKKLERIRFSIVRERTYEPIYITDENVVLYDVLQTHDMIGLDHPDPRRNSFHQQAIHID